MTDPFPPPGANMAEPRRMLAVIGALVTVAIWANFMVTSGGMVGAGLGVVELGLMRAGVCALALAPVIRRIGLYPKGLAPGRFAVMLLGAGFSFLYLLPAGYLFASPASSGAFAPGLLPLWVAILSMIFLGEKIGARRGFGFALILLGVFAVGGWDAIANAADGAWKGYLMFASSSFFFACYAVAQRGSGLDAVQATALLSFWLVPIAGAVALVRGVDFGVVSPGALAWTALAMLFSGVVAIITYTYAVMQLGPSRASAFMALTPAAVALGSDIFLDQPASALVWAGIAVVSAGVLIASGVLERR
ncbi:MAG: DMT family transporter [Pikeienuella sp.]